MLSVKVQTAKAAGSGPGRLIFIVRGLSETTAHSYCIEQPAIEAFTVNRPITNDCCTLYPDMNVPPGLKTVTYPKII